MRPTFVSVLHTCITLSVSLSFAVCFFFALRLLHISLARRHSIPDETPCGCVQVIFGISHDRIWSARLQNPNSTLVSLEYNKMCKYYYEIFTFCLALHCSLCSTVTIELSECALSAILSFYLSLRLALSDSLPASLQAHTIVEFNRRRSADSCPMAANLISLRVAEIREWLVHIA